MFSQCYWQCTLVNGQRLLWEQDFMKRILQKKALCLQFVLYIILCHIILYYIRLLFFFLPYLIWNAYPQGQEIVPLIRWDCQVSWPWLHDTMIRGLMFYLNLALGRETVWWKRLDSDSEQTMISNDIPPFRKMWDQCLFGTNMCIPKKAVGKMSGLCHFLPLCVRERQCQDHQWCWGRQFDLESHGWDPQSWYPATTKNWYTPVN